MGASAGGVAAFQKILGRLDSMDFPPIVAVLHLPANAKVDFQLAFSNHDRVFEAEDKMPLEAGCVYFAPPNHHVLLERGYLSVTQDDPVQHSRPSIDVLFASAAWSYQNRTCGIVLTGANEDGAEGLLAIAKAGGTTIVLDPQHAEMPIMPQAALQKVNPDFVIQLNDIPELLLQAVQSE